MAPMAISARHSISATKYAPAEHNPPSQPHQLIIQSCCGTKSVARMMGIMMAKPMIPQQSGQSA